MRHGPLICRSVLDEFELVRHEHEQLRTLLDDLRRRNHDLEHNKLGRIKAWRKGWNLSLCIAKLGVTVLSVVFPMARARAAAIASNNGASGVIGLLQQLVDSHLAGQQSSCEDERDLTAKILNEASFIYHRVNSFQNLVQRLEDQMGLLAQYAEFLAVAGEDEDAAVSMAMEKIKDKAGELVVSIENLEEKVDRSCDDLRRAALTLLQTITHEVFINYVEDHLKYHKKVLLTRINHYLLQYDNCYIWFFSSLGFSLIVFCM